MLMLSTPPLNWCCSCANQATGGTMEVALPISGRALAVGRSPTVVNDGHLESVEQPEGPDDNEVQRKMQKLFMVWPMKPAELKGKVDKIANEASSGLRKKQPGISLSYIYQLLNGTRKDLGRDKEA